MMFMSGLDVGDFGLSKSLIKHGPCTNAVGTADYLSPEFATAFMSKRDSSVTGVECR